MFIVDGMPGIYLTKANQEGYINGKQYLGFIHAHATNCAKNLCIEYTNILQYSKLIPHLYDKYLYDKWQLKWFSDRTAIYDSSCMVPCTFWFSIEIIAFDNGSSVKIWVFTALGDPPTNNFYRLSVQDF